jgi:hypothetical protein
MTHTEAEPPAEPKPVWTITDSTYVGRYYGGEACGRTGYSRQTDYWNGHRCTQDGGSTQWYRLELTHGEYV